jgi:hypothetical protein
MWKKMHNFMKSGRLSKVTRLVLPDERKVARRKGRQTETRKQVIV